MQLRFLQGNPNTPKGHALIFVRSSGDSRRLFAVYCVVLPINFSIGKFIPPILAAQMPPEGLGEAARLKAVPIPPMLEEVGGLEQLERLADLRGDDLCEIVTTILPEDEQTRMMLPAEASEAYATLYATYANGQMGMQGQGAISEQISEMPLDDLDVDAVLSSVLSDRDRLEELSKLIGTARYALEGKDLRLLRETEQKLRRTADPLPEKYKARELIKAALEAGERGWKLAQLYLERGYKLVNEQYAEIPRIEREIRDLTNNQG
jgi:hypothetical protein